MSIKKPQLKIKTKTKNLYKYKDQTRNLYISLELALKSYSKYGNFTKAAKAGGISFYALKECLVKYPKFKKKWEEAHDIYMDGLEDIALKRAKAGSDTLLKFLMTAGRPEKYGRINNTFVQNNINVEESIKEASIIAKQIKAENINKRKQIPTVLEFDKI